MNNNKQSVEGQRNSKTKSLVRKPSIKKREPPEVKQTLTSKYRLLKANPLLAHELEKAIVNNNKAEGHVLSQPLKTLANALDANLGVSTGKPGKIRIERTLESETSRANSKVEIYPKPAANFNNVNMTKIDFKPGHFLSSTVIENKQESNKKCTKPTVLIKKPAAENDNKQTKTKEPLRRSLSAQYLEKQKKRVAHVNQSAKKSHSSTELKSRVTNSNPKMVHSVRKSQSFEELSHSVTKAGSSFNSNRKMIYSVRKSQSFEELNQSTARNFKPGASRPFPKSQSCDNLKKSMKIDELNISTITEESNSLNISNTPQPLVRTTGGQNRRSSLWTPNNRRSLFLNAPSSSDMSKRLTEWLQRRGKSLGDYHHLRCFGIHGHGKKEVVNSVDEENKENIETDMVNRSSYEELKIREEPDGNDEVVAPRIVVETVDLEDVAKEALRDLHKLILEGYPGEQCEAWLRLIKEKYSKLEEDPQYWECRAAQEQSKGNINNAVECYKTAIIQGAEVQAVDKSLDQLLQKFSLLNINKDTKTDTENKERARIVQDARNIFKSSIIQFAVQERILKTKTVTGVRFETKVTATPVRRSTRLSRSGFTSTPGITIFSSLQEASKSTPHKISFQHNKALND